MATDGSDLAARALGPAAWFAGRLGAGLELVTVVPEGQVARATAAIADERAEGVGTRRVLVGDDPADAIATAITTGDGAIGCLATHARSRTAPVLGSTAQAVLERTWAPLLLVGPRADAVRRDGPVVVAVAGGRDDEDLVAVAAGWAARLDRPLVLVTVAEPAPSGVDGQVHRTRGPQDPDAYLASLADRLTATARPATDVVEDPISVRDGLVPLLQRIQPCLVVVGHHEHGRLHRVVTGDHTADVVAVAPAPVLAVPVGLHR